MVACPLVGQRQRGDRRRRLSGCCQQQRLQGEQPALQQRGAEPAFVVFELEPDLLAAATHVERQVEQRTGRQLLVVLLQVREGPRWREIDVIAQHLEQRVAVWVALGGDALHQSLERQLGAVVGPETACVYPVGELPEGRLIAAVDPQRQAVDEETHHVGELGIAAGCWRADGKVDGAGTTMQQHRETAQEPLERRQSEFAGGAQHGLAASGVQRQRDPGAAGRLRVVERLFSGQLECRQVAQFLLPFGLQLSASPAGEPAPLPEGVLGVAAQGPELGRLTLAFGGVERGALPGQQRHREAVDDHVMQAPDMFEALVVELQEALPQERSALQVECRQCHPVALTVTRGQQLRTGQRAQIDQRQADVRRCRDTGPGASVDSGEGSAQQFVPLDQRRGRAL